MAEQFTPEEAKMTRHRAASERLLKKHGAEEAEGGLILTPAQKERASKLMEKEEKKPAYWDGRIEHWRGKREEAGERVSEAAAQNDFREVRDALAARDYANERAGYAQMRRVRLEQTWEDGELQPGGRVRVFSTRGDKVYSDWELVRWDGDNAVVRRQGSQGQGREVPRGELYLLNPPPESRAVEQQQRWEAAVERVRDELHQQARAAFDEARRETEGSPEEERALERAYLLRRRFNWSLEGNYENHWHVGPAGEQRLLAGGGVDVEIQGAVRRCLLDRYDDELGRAIVWDPATNNEYPISEAELYRLNPRPGEEEAAEGQQWEVFFGQLNEALDQLQQPGWIVRQAQRGENPIKALIRRGGEMGVSFFEGRAQEAEGDLAVAVQRVGVLQGMVGEAYGHYKQEKERLEVVRTNNVNARRVEINAYIAAINEEAQRDKEAADRVYGRWFVKLTLAHLWARPFDNMLHSLRFDRPQRRAERMLRDYEEVQGKLLEQDLRPVRNAYGQAMERMQPNLREWEEARMQLSDLAAKRRKWADRAHGVASLLGVEAPVPAAAA